MSDNTGLILALTLGAMISLAGIIYPFKPFKKRWIALISFLACFLLIGVFIPSLQPNNNELVEPSVRLTTNSNGNDLHWVTAERLNRRTCPSESCGIVGRLLFREGVRILERRDGWVRITEPYASLCVGGRVAYVDSGNAACNDANGFTDGEFAEWVSADYLAEDRPPDPAASASGAEKLVAGSDDFARYRTAFAEAAQSLIAERRCTERDFRETGGWSKSHHHDQPIYFVYCGGFTANKRLYLNTHTGKIFR
ncbi:SH3 domain-containing protein [Acuticoccus sp.]|uniref:SH3 domain-containing protein n=1 Tax=Acuticoccus sp. TaxID=1904378 RepID=UPI003B5257F1